MARRALTGLMALTVSTALGAAPARAGVPGVIAETARTAADGVRDGVLTFARTTRAFVFGGASAAEDTWGDNVDAMRARAQRNADRVRAEAGMASAPAYREYRDEDASYRDDRRDEGAGAYHSEEPLPPVVPEDQ
jgi:hypothetical protein